MTPAVRPDQIRRFLLESLGIEGVHREPTTEEMHGTEALLALKRITLPDLLALQAIYTPGKPMREHPGMDVQIGMRLAPGGGPAIREMLVAWLATTDTSGDPYLAHCEYERIHPFLDGNGRTGRTLWAWHMLRVGLDPFRLSFLHRWYYQSLRAAHAQHASSSRS